jgi:hypothetical protein
MTRIPGTGLIFMKKHVVFDFKVSDGFGTPAANSPIVKDVHLLFNVGQAVISCKGFLTRNILIAQYQH